MNRIFAKHLSDKKVIAFCATNQVQTIAKNLKKEFGGDWLLVENLSVNQAIVFSDGLVYRGFEVEKKTYCNSIIKI